MRTLTLALSLLILSIWTTPPAMALMDSKADLAGQASVPMEKALQTALQKVPGKAIEAELETEDGRPAYEIKIIDSTNTKRKVHVDARTGDVMKVK